MTVFDRVAIPIARAYRPELILISAGYDAHREDPLGGCLLETATYAELTHRMRKLAEEAGAPMGAVLEGGYDLTALAESVVATMEALAPSTETVEDSPPSGLLPDQSAGDGPAHDASSALAERLVAEAIAAHARNWPVLSTA